MSDACAEFPTPWRVLDECDWHWPIIVDADGKGVVSGKVASVLHRIVAAVNAVEAVSGMSENALAYIMACAKGDVA